MKTNNKFEILNILQNIDEIENINSIRIKTEDKEFIINFLDVEEDRIECWIYDGNNQNYTDVYFIDSYLQSVEGEYELEMN